MRFCLGALTGLLLVSAAPPVRASICSGPSIHPGHEMFEGELVAARGAVLRFRVRATYAGSARGLVEVRTSRRTLTAGPSQVGQIFFVAARRRRGRLLLVCGRESLVRASRLDASIQDRLRALDLQRVPVAP